jgi:hypothetical protein
MPADPSGRSTGPTGRDLATARRAVAARSSAPRQGPSDLRGTRSSPRRPRARSWRLRRCGSPSLRSWASARTASRSSTATTWGGRPARRAATAAANPSRAPTASGCYHAVVTASGSPRVAAVSSTPPPPPSGRRRSSAPPDQGAAARTAGVGGERDDRRRVVPTTRVASPTHRDYSGFTSEVSNLGLTDGGSSRILYRGHHANRGRFGDPVWAGLGDTGACRRRSCGGSGPGQGD